MTNLVFGNYVTSATFCLKLGKSEIAALTLLDQAKKLKDNTDASLWSLGSKGLVAVNAQQEVELTETGGLAISMLKQAGLIK